MSTEIVEGVNYENPLISRMLGFEKSKYQACEFCNFVGTDILDLRAHIAREHPDKDPNIDPLRHVKKGYRNKDKKRLTMGELFAKKIASKHNQHVLLTIVGKTGMGKSNAALHIAIKTAEHLVKIKGGKVEDYFTIDNCAIMDIKEIIPIMANLKNKRFNIIILDDIGASYGARDFNSKINKSLGKVFQTFRDSNTLVIFTVPDNFLMDKIGRKLAHYQIEMTKQAFHKKTSMGKLSEVKEIYKAGKTIYPFIVEDGVKYRGCAFKLVENELHLEYERRRAIVRERMTKENIETIMEMSGEQKKEKERAIPKYQAISGQAYRMKLNNPKMSNRAIADKLGCDPGTIGKSLKYAKSALRE